jgi:hypothetical protein
MSHIYPQDFKYAVISSTDLNNVDFKEDILPKIQSELRYSLDGSEFIIKWNEDHTPAFISNGDVVPIAILTHDECLLLLRTTPWMIPNPIEKENENQTEEFDGDSGL